MVDSDQLHPDGNQRVTADLVRAANERTSFTEESAQRNVDLQRTANEVVRTLLNTSGTDEQRRARVLDALGRYGSALNAFEQTQGKAAQQRREYPYPTTADIDRRR
jgi:hypothetical protein